MMAAVLALLASLIWGTSDFLGGTLSRRIPAIIVVGFSQAAAMVVLVPVAAGAGGFGADSGYLPWAIGAGAVGLLALGAFYHGLATGSMGVVAPIAAMGVAVPIAVGFAEGDAPGGLQIAGLAIAAVGVVLASGPRAEGGRNLRPVVLAGLSAVGFGLVILFIAKGSAHSVVMTLLVMRATSVLPLVVLGLAAGRLGVSTREAGPHWRMLAVVGLADLTANGAYAVASRHGLLALVAVLSSLYPVVTVLLARVVPDERLRSVQTVGVIAALAGVILIGAGGGTG
jgi:drug/metabolite transporter (DMT)-like permease